MDNTEMGIKVEDLLKNWRGLWIKKTHIQEHMENDETFETHWDLCQSEEGKCLWTQ